MRVEMLKNPKSEIRRASMSFVTTLHRGLVLRAEGEEKRAFEDIRESEIESLRRVFDEVDADGSGHVDQDELHEAMRRAGKKISRRQCRALFNEADQDGDGTIDFKEFAEMFAKAAVDDDFDEPETLPRCTPAENEACFETAKITLTLDQRGELALIPEKEVDQENVGPSCFATCEVAPMEGHEELPEGHTKIQINVSKDDLLF